MRHFVYRCDICGKKLPDDVDVQDDYSLERVGWSIKRGETSHSGYTAFWVYCPDCSKLLLNKKYLY